MTVAAGQRRDHTPMGEPKPLADALGEITVLRNPLTGEPYADVEAADDPRVAAERAAAGRKAVFEHRRVGGEARSGRLPRRLIPSLAAGVTNLMLLKLLNEEVVPLTAKEAADIAKVTATIARDASGEGKGSGPLSPEERAARLADVQKFEAVLEARASEATAALGGAPLDPAEWDLGDDSEVPATPSV